MPTTHGQRTRQSPTRRGLLFHAVLPVLRRLSARAAGARSASTVTDTTRGPAPAAGQAGDCWPTGSRAINGRKGWHPRPPSPPPLPLLSSSLSTPALPCANIPTQNKRCTCRVSNIRREDRERGVEGGGGGLLRAEYQLSFQSCTTTVRRHLAKSINSRGIDRREREGKRERERILRKYQH